MVNFILSTWGDAHQLNRLLTIEKLGIRNHIYAYERDYYPSGVERDYTSIGKLRNGKYLYRVFTYVNAFFIFLKLSFKPSSVFYIFGLDNLLLFYLTNVITFRKHTLFYEIPDIRPFEYKDTFLSKMIRRLTKSVLKNIDVVVVTSPEYITQFYKNYVGIEIENYIVLENKLHHLDELEDVSETFKPLEAKSYGLNKRDVIIGYFGLLRCEKSLQVLLELSKRRLDIFIVLRGIFMSNTKHLKNAIKERPNMVYLGPYVSPSDLPLMYQEVDISWIAYPYSKEKIGNWKWARTNRYYEAGYFGKPMIASKGTQDANNVKRYDMGVVVELREHEGAVEKLSSAINIENINEWKNNLIKLDKSDFNVTDDYLDLAKKIREYI